MVREAHPMILLEMYLNFKEIRIMQVARELMYFMFESFQLLIPTLGYIFTVRKKYSGLVG